MSNYDFDAETREFSKKNAYGLGRASLLAYEKEKDIKTETYSWGLGEFDFFANKDTQAFISGNDDVLLLAFRGTEPKSLKDWMTVANVDLISGPGGKVHEGFSTALSCVWSDVWKFIREKRGRRALLITGHSLGAALATLAVAKLRLEKDEPVNGLYTFGHPRTGDKDFAKNFNSDFSSQTFRYVNNNDIVARVPFRAMHYSHVGTFKYFDKSGNENHNISWWDKVQDRLLGRIDDFLKPGTDGIKDHSMKKYVKNLKKAAEKK